MKNLSLFLLLLVLSMPAKAARFSGDYLLKICGVNEQGEELVEGGHIACQSYIAGVMDYHNLIRSLGTSPSVDFCVPEEATMKEIHSRVANYINDNHHEQGPFIAAPGVALALFKAYPCP
ncbi:MAG: Rap1a/Tai family immunity protein [Pseudomonadota bacterium]